MLNYNIIVDFSEVFISSDDNIESWSNKYYISEFELIKLSGILLWRDTGRELDIGEFARPIILGDCINFCREKATPFLVRKYPGEKLWGKPSTTYVEYNILDIEEGVKNGRLV